MRSYRHERLECHFDDCGAVLASQLAKRMKPARVLPAAHPPGVHFPVSDATLNASAAWSRSETTPQG
jgi:hypothetical protein